MNYEFYRYDHSSEIVKTNLNEFWICRVDKGRVTIQFEQEQYELSTDSVFIVQEGARFKMLSSSPDMIMECIVFYESLMNIVYSLLGAEADFGQLETSFCDDKKLDKFYEHVLCYEYELLYHAIERPNIIARNKMITASLAHLLIIIYNVMDVESKPLQSDNSKRSRLLLNHFYESLAENTFNGHRDVRFYADNLSISERYLFKICKKETGKTPKNLIDEFLVVQIKNALLITEMSLQQLADQFAFPDQSAFGQYFKRQEGISPSEFRMRFR